MADRLSNLEIAIKVLTAANGEELKVAEIVKRAAVLGLLGDLSQEAFLPKLMASMSGSVKRKDSPFTRVKNGKGGFKAGTYKLKTVRKPPLVIPTPETAPTGSDFIGHAGEHAVMAELLFNGYNASLMTVDRGIDIVASNDSGKYFHIQVKTARPINGLFTFTIKRKAFDANNSSQTFYILALRHDRRCDYIVFPNAQIASYIALNVIKGSDALFIRISQDSKTKKYTLNGVQDVTIFANRFGQIC